jgi:hypothetical protein
MKGIQVCSNKRPGSLERGDNYKNVKMGWGHWKIFFSRTTGLILTRLGTNHSWGEGFQVCSNEGDCPSPRGDNSERVIIHWKLKKKKFFSRTSKPNSIKLGTNNPWVKGVQVCSNKGPGPLERGDNYKNVKMGWGHWKIFFSRTTRLLLTRLGINHP